MVSSSDEKHQLSLMSVNPKGFSLTLNFNNLMFSSLDEASKFLFQYLYLYLSIYIDYFFARKGNWFYNIWDSVSCNSQKAELPRLTSWKYVTEVTQMLVNKEFNWMTLTLAPPFAPP